MAVVDQADLSVIARLREELVDAENLLVAARAGMAVAEAKHQLARAVFSQAVHLALLKVGASPNDGIDEATGEVKPRPMAP